MPKIRKADFRIETPEKRVFFQADMMYSTKQGFYIVLPHEYLEAVTSMTIEQRQKFSLEAPRKSIFKLTISKILVTGVTEADCEENVAKAVKYLATLSVKKREVIVIHLDTGASNYHGRDEDLKPTRVEMGITYCTEITLGNNISYCRFKPSPWPDEKDKTIRQTLSLGQGCVVIDDTETNRQFLEKLYGALKHLKDQLDEYLKTPESVMQLITSQVKLLG